MPLLPASELRLARAIGELAVCNPFTQRRVELEKGILGKQFAGTTEFWVVDPEHLGENPNGALMRVVVDPEHLGENPNVPAIEALTESLIGKARAALEKSRCTDEELAVYEELVLYHLYSQYERPFHDLCLASGAAATRMRAPFYERFEREVRSLLKPVGFDAPHRTPEHLFAILFQIRRAFEHTFRHILGTSRAAAALRQAVWQSIFTADMRRYRAHRYGAMQELSTLILGKSGTGKELVARAIGLSRYIPFDPKKGEFTEDFRACYQPINLAAMAPTLIESEIFGHRKGSFTGATGDRAGYLESASPAYSVFFDEIGELGGEIQVKLLRVLQTREFQRLGENTPRRFEGKILAATNRDLAGEMQEGKFREDLYYRLCSDVIETPSLREQLRQSPGELANLLRLLAGRILPADDAREVAAQAHEWIEQHMGPEYPWPGNIRELEQCVRNVLVRGEYHPAAAQARASTVRQQLAQDVIGGALSADELLTRYCTIVFSESGQYETAARRLLLDRRTVKSRVDEQLLAALHAEAPGKLPGGESR